MINFLSYCDDLKPVISILKAVVAVLRFGVPILLIILELLI